MEPEDAKKKGGVSKNDGNKLRDDGQSYKSSNVYQGPESTDEDDGTDKSAKKD